MFGAGGGMRSAPQPESAHRRASYPPHPMKRLIASLSRQSRAARVRRAGRRQRARFPNNFSKQKDVKRIGSLGGGKVRALLEGQEGLGVRVKTGHKNCLWRTPVEGDAKQPDYILQAVAKVSSRRRTRRSAKQVYVGLAARVNRTPATRSGSSPRADLQLLKNGDTVDAGQNKAISAARQEEPAAALEVVSRRHRQGQRQALAKFEDNNPDEVIGRKTAITFGSEARSNKDGFVALTTSRPSSPIPDRRAA